MLCASQNKINAKTTTNRNCLIPNRGGFGPLEAVVFESVVIRAAFPPSQGACKARQFPAVAVDTRQHSVSYVSFNTTSVNLPSVHEKGRTYLAGLF
jgi:hypothetical protein